MYNKIKENSYMKNNINSYLVIYNLTYHYLDEGDNKHYMNAALDIGMTYSMIGSNSEYSLKLYFRRFEFLEYHYDFIKYMKDDLTHRFDITEEEADNILFSPDSFNEWDLLDEYIDLIPHETLNTMESVNSIRSIYEFKIMHYCNMKSLLESLLEMLDRYNELFYKTISGDLSSTEIAEMNFLAYYFDIYDKTLTKEHKLTYKRVRTYRDILRDEDYKSLANYAIISRFDNPDFMFWSAPEFFLYPDLVNKLWKYIPDLDTKITKFYNKVGLVHYKAISKENKEFNFTTHIPLKNKDYYELKDKIVNETEAFFKKCELQKPDLSDNIEPKRLRKYKKSMSDMRYTRFITRNRTNNYRINKRLCFETSDMHDYYDIVEEHIKKIYEG